MTDRSSPVESAEGFTGTRWRHLKRGTSYEVVGVAKLQTALTEGLADETPMVVYRNEATNKLSVRSLDEFCDGRFEKLGRAAHAQSVPDGYILVPEGYGTIPNPGDVRKANHGIAKWLSAALDDPAVCDAMKSDINNWFAAHEPGPSPIQWAQAPAQCAPEPSGWLHEITEPMCGYTRMYSSSSDNPWSHWVEDHKAKCDYKATPLYASTVTSTERPSAAERDPADVWDDYCAEVPNEADRSPQGAMAFALSSVEASAVTSTVHTPTENKEGGAS